LALSQEQLTALARHGAQARINELRQEIAAIEQAFSNVRLKRRGRPRKQARQAAGANGSTEAPAKRGRSRGWSAAARKAAAARMKAYWAKRKAGRKK
jgi:hypothetical protein